MNGDQYPAMGLGNQPRLEGAPQPAPQPLNNYLIRCVNGWSINTATPYDLMTFVKFAIADGGIPSDKMFIVWRNIVSIEYIGPYVPGQSVTAFGPRPVG